MAPKKPDLDPVNAFLFQLLQLVEKKVGAQVTQDSESLSEADDAQSIAASHERDDARNQKHQQPVEQTVEDQSQSLQFLPCEKTKVPSQKTQEHLKNVLDSFTDEDNVAKSQKLTDDKKIDAIKDLEIDMIPKKQANSWTVEKTRSVSSVINELLDAIKRDNVGNDSEDAKTKTKRRDAEKRKEALADVLEFLS